MTGQHPALDVSQFRLASYARAELGCAGEANPHAHVRKVARAIAPELDGAELVIVQGDTSSALGGALAAVRASIPLAHVEAGLRTGDRLQPWPEEDYRVRIDRYADLLFAVTEQSAGNLASESVAGEVHITGNTGIDALTPMLADLPPPRVHDRSGAQILVTCHRRESWRAGLHRIAEALVELARDGAAAIDFILHPNPQIASLMRSLLGGRRNVQLLPPCGHRELIRRMSEADIILSDSGGMQEEAPALGVPLLILRERTERPEGIATGNMRLVGTCPDRIVTEVRRLLDDPLAYAAMARRAHPYGDGHAAPRIASIVERWLSDRAAANNRSAALA